MPTRRLDQSEKAVATDQHLCKDRTTIWLSSRFLISQESLAGSLIIRILEFVLKTRLIQNLASYSAYQLDFRHDDTWYFILSLSLVHFSLSVEIYSLRTIYFART